MPPIWPTCSPPRPRPWRNWRGRADPECPARWPREPPAVGPSWCWNTCPDDWIEFLRHQRLGHQFELAASQGYGGGLYETGQRLLENLAAFFQGYRPRPALLHGDLWSGNVDYTEAGEPVIFDPASYYGDREADLAMTELFGGFPRPFYEAYRHAAPLDPGYGVRRDLYNLYHVLNHLNLFGSGYLGQARALVDRLLAELG